MKFQKRFLLAILRHFLWSVGLTAFAFAASALLLQDYTALAYSLLMSFAVLGWLFWSRKRSKLQQQSVSWLALWLALLTFGVFALFFWRRDIGFLSIDTGHIIAKQVFTAMTAMLLMCLGYYVARLHPILRPNGKSVVGVLKLFIVFAPFLLLVARSVQPNLPSWCHVAPIETGDWVVVGSMVLVFAAVLEIQESTAHHNPHALIEKHGHETIKKHLNPTIKVGSKHGQNRIS